MSEVLEVNEVGSDNIMPTPLGFTVHMSDDVCVGISLNRTSRKYNVISFSYSTNKPLYVSEEIEAYAEAKSQLKDFVEKHFSRNLFINFLTVI